MLNGFIKWFLPLQEEGRYELRVAVFRVLAFSNILLGLFYLIWRYTSSLNFDALWFAIPLVLAETYSYLDSLMFVFMMWKPPRRKTPIPIGNETVDVYITTYNEPIELVRLTAEAATRIAWPHLNVYILDDGSRPAFRELALEIGCKYIARGEEWKDKPRHAKAGNVNNALMQTTGEFILILDADQIPAPEIIHRTIGYFQDKELAFVQTPQYFYNLPHGDPFGSDAPLFYGPIQQGKDGWNAAFFCGSNAILRREALFQLGLTEYVRDIEQETHEGLQKLKSEIKDISHRMVINREVLDSLKTSLDSANAAHKKGESLEAVSDMVRKAVNKAKQAVVIQDIKQIIEDLNDLAKLGNSEAIETLDYLKTEYSRVITEILEGESTDAIGISEETLDVLALTRPEEAIPIMPLSTISITEDMSTAMRLHALGWKSLFHSEILAYGLAPEDLGTALTQRLRWAQGTIQVFLRENPLLIRGLSFPQRLQYLTTMFSYFSGFFTLIYLFSPIIYLFTSIPPVSAWSIEFAWRLFPFLLLNKFIFRYIAWGLSVWRGEQYSLALFPLWIQAVISVVTGKKLSFVVTPKQRQSGNFLPLVWPQVMAIWLTAFSILFGLFSFSVGWNLQTEGLLVNIFWGSYNIIMLSAIVRAAVYKPPKGWDPKPPEFLFFSARG